MMRYYEPEDKMRLLKLPFYMVIDEIFTIKSRGVIVTGWIEAGTLSKTDSVVVQGKGRSILVTQIAFSWQDVIEPGRMIGILLRDVLRDEVESGMIITKAETSS
jgi:translation elongation factor EF-Tu-like GTPase